MSDALRNYMKSLPEAITSSYENGSVNSAIPIFEGNIKLIQNSSIVATDKGRLFLSWLPTPRLLFETEAVPLGADLEEATLELSELQLLVKALITNIGGTDYGSRGIIQSPLAKGVLNDCEYVIFYLANFQRFVGERIRDPQASHFWAGRLELVSDNWLVTIDSTQATDNIIKQLKAEGGHAITHTGTIRRVDGRSFSYSDADDVLTALTYFLSFCRGAWCSSVLAIGYKSTQEVWQQWGIRNITAWKSTESWMPHEDPLALREITHAFLGFMRKWGTSTWNESLKIAIHWYIEANIGAGGVEGAIVLSQTALELLGWVFLVEDTPTKKMSGGKFDDLNAASKLRLLLGELRIPPIIPRELANLVQVAAQGGTVDGLEIFVKLRNGVVHPKQSKRSFVLQTSKLARYEAKELGLWYLELALLAICGYRGSYYQRYHQGFYAESLTAVPWR